MVTSPPAAAPAGFNWGWQVWLASLRDGLLLGVGKARRAGAEKKMLLGFGSKKI